MVTYYLIKTFPVGFPKALFLVPRFSYCINDFNNVSNVIDVILLADDTNLYQKMSSHKDPSYLINILNLTLNRLSNWFKANSST